LKVTESKLMEKLGRKADIGDLQETMANKIDSGAVQETLEGKASASELEKLRYNLKTVTA